MYGQNLISIEHLTTDEIVTLIEKAAEFKVSPNSQIAQGKILATCFFEPSTRTRLSFESAALRLGAQVVSVSSAEGTSISKKESLNDSLRVISNYSDCVAVRVPTKLTDDDLRGTSVPIINAGDGSFEHPTQTLVDLFTLHQCFKKLQGLKIALVGDLFYGRTVHSLLRVAHLFDFEIFLLASPGLGLSKEYEELIAMRKVKVNHCSSLEEILPVVDAMYMTRMQKERGKSGSDFPEHTLTIELDLLNKYAHPGLKILHPLPRNEEIPTAIDDTPYAYYFEQAANGVYIRQALLASILGCSL